MLILIDLSKILYYLWGKVVGCGLWVVLPVQRSIGKKIKNKKYINYYFISIDQ